MVDRIAVASGGVPWFGAGTLAQRPQPGDPGRVYLVVEEADIFLSRDTGVSWRDIRSGETPEQILAKLLTVDADDSGLNATTLRGQAPAAFLGAGAKATDSELLDGQEATAFAPASHVGSRDGHPTATATEAGFISGANNVRIHDRLHGLGSQDHSDVRNAPQDGQVQVFRSAGPSGLGYYHEAPGAASVPNATETEAGKVEKGTRADYDANADAGTSGPLYVPVTLLRTLLTPEAVIRPSFINGWVNFGGTHEAAGYYKDPLGRVHLLGTIRGGTSGANAFVLPVGYRPPAAAAFATAGDTAADTRKITVGSDGGVLIQAAVGDVSEVGLNGVSFRVA